MARKSLHANPRKPGKVAQPSSYIMSGCGREPHNSVIGFADCIFERTQSGALANSCCSPTVFWLEELPFQKAQHTVRIHVEADTPFHIALVDYLECVALLLCLTHQISRFTTSRAFSSMNLRRASTFSPISVVKISSAATASSSFTWRSVRVSAFMVVSQSCSAFISPRPLKRVMVKSFLASSTT